MSNSISSLANYQDWLNTIKQRVVSARLRVALAANSELIALYYEIGAQIMDREAHARWGSGFIDGFSKDLRQTFPEVGGFSSKNLRYCRAFFRFYCDPAIWQQAVAKLPDTPWAGIDEALAAQLGQIPWGHNILIFTKCSSVEEAVFYIAQTTEQGWKRDLLRVKGGITDYCVIGEIDVQALRRFQSSHRSPDKPFKPVPDGFEIDYCRKVLPAGETE